MDPPHGHLLQVLATGGIIQAASGFFLARTLHYRETNMLRLLLGRRHNAIFIGALFVSYGFSNAERVASGVDPKREAVGHIERLDPALDKLVPSDAKMEVIAEGLEWCESPAWVRDGEFLLFSDIPRNSIMRWDAKSGSQLFLKPSGYTGTKARGGEPGSNGLVLDRKGRLVLCQHGDRRVARLDSSLKEPTPKFVTLADRYEGKRLNSPNDAVVDS